MLSNFAFSARQILWTLTFAAQLVLLVVLLGRDRARRYPWFTAGVVIFSLRLLAEVLLAGRMPMLALQEIFLSLADLAAVVSLLVVVEIAWHAFARASRRAWIIGVVVMLAVAVGVLVAWGPWPALKDLSWNSKMGVLRLMQLAAQKGDTLVDVLTVEVGLLVVFLGRKFKAGWQSHTQKIVIGLSVVAAAWMGIQGAWQLIAHNAHPATQEEYARIMALGGKLINASQVVYLVAAVWWIAWLWRDEPGTEAASALATENGNVLPAENANVLPAEIAAPVEEAPKSESDSTQL
jgi:DNA segregation ATPase FtsK/SpoIIIE-like protein